MGMLKIFFFYGWCTLYSVVRWQRFVYVNLTSGWSHFACVGVAPLDWPCPSVISRGEATPMPAKWIKLDPYYEPISDLFLNHLIPGYINYLMLPM